MKDWYDRIEKPVRPLVKLLRDNGYNTVCSCGHKMYVECEYYWDSIHDLFNLLWDHGYKDFKVEILVGQNRKIGTFKNFIIWLLKPDGTFDQQSKYSIKDITDFKNRRYRGYRENDNKEKP